MAEISTLVQLLNCYGVAVRAGVVTPQKADEIYFRQLMDLPQMGEDVSKDWAETNGVRHPLTIKRPGEDAPAIPMGGGEE
jgi:hypothetical protein